jgi:hypothetical protein
LKDESQANTQSNDDDVVVTCVCPAGRFDVGLHCYHCLGIVVHIVGVAAFVLALLIVTFTPRGGPQTRGARPPTRQEKRRKSKQQNHIEAPNHQMQIDKERSNVFQCYKDGRFKRTKDGEPAVGMLAVV